MAPRTISTIRSVKEKMTPAGISLWGGKKARMMAMWSEARSLLPRGAQSINRKVAHQSSATTLKTTFHACSTMRKKVRLTLQTKQ